MNPEPVTVLFVEDSDADADLISMALERAGRERGVVRARDARRGSRNAHGGGGKLGEDCSLDLRARGVREVGAHVARAAPAGCVAESEGDEDRHTCQGHHYLGFQFHCLCDRWGRFHSAPE